MTLSHNKKLLATTSFDKMIKLYESGSIECTMTLQGHTDSVHRCVFSKDDTLLISISNDKTVKVWNLYSGHCITTLTYNETMRCCDISPDNQSFIIGSSKGLVLHINSLKTIKKFETTTSICKYSPNGKYLALYSDSAGLTIWNASTYDLLQKLTWKASNICWSKDGQYLIIVHNEYHCFSLKLCNTSTWDCIQNLSETSFMNHISLSNNGLLLLIHDPHTFSLWNMKTIKDEPVQPRITKPFVQSHKTESQINKFTGLIHKTELHTNESNIVIVVYMTQCLAAHKFSAENNQFEKELIEAEHPQFIELLQDKLLYCSALIFVLSEGSLDNENCINALEYASKKNKKVVLVHDTKSRFPQYSKINTLPNMVRELFSTIAIPLVPEYADKCWKKVSDKIHNKIPPPKKMNWFLSHRQVTGQRIALSLYLELVRLGDTAFLDVKAELDLHDLEKIVELCDFFVFVYSDGILASEYCRKEFAHAVKCKKPIVIIRDMDTVPPKESEIPEEWKAFKGLLTTSRTQVYCAYYLTELAEKLKIMRENASSNIKSKTSTYYCDASYQPHYPLNLP